MPNDAVQNDGALHVLFIGNSQMISNDLPGMVSAISKTAPKDCRRIEAHRGIVDGASLKKCWDATGEGSPRAMIAARRYDWVVIQEIFCAEREMFERYAAQFDDMIRANGSKTMLFATANVTEVCWGPSYRYPDCFRALNDMQIAFGKARGIPVAAAGYAWMKYLGPNPSDAERFALYHEDKGHPGFKGSCIYALLLYAHITGSNPERLALSPDDLREGITSVTQEELARMQKAAWRQYVESGTTSANE